MQILVNSEPHEISVSTLAEALTALGYTSPAIATAVNGQFIARSRRESTMLVTGDRVEILSPMQGG